jgi:hypothetical protein
VARPTDRPFLLENGIQNYYAAVQASAGLFSVGAFNGLTFHTALPWNFSAQTNAFALGNANLEVEKVLGWELGYKGSLSNMAYFTAETGGQGGRAQAGRAGRAGRAGSRIVRPINPNRPPVHPSARASVHPSGRQPLDLPPFPGSPIADPIVQPVLPALPELHLVGPEPVTAPMRWQRNFLPWETLFRDP